MNYSFKRELRLLTPKDFERVFQDPTVVSCNNFTVLARKNDLTHPRLGLAIAKKVISKSHLRNKVKRLIRESFRLNQHNIGNLDIVVLVRPGIIKTLEKKDNSLIFNSLNKLWHRQCKKM